jgi:nucleotide-binding universal stress UspA family protein
MIHEQMEHAPELLDRAAQTIRRNSPWLTVTTQVVEGAPAEVIVREACDWGADLIVLGSHGRSPLKQALLGSVASAVAANAPCAVEIVRGARKAVEVHAAR